MYYLFKENKIINKSDNLEELIQIIINSNLHTEYYGENINNKEKWNEYFDVHEGVYFSVDSLLDKNNSYCDMFIVEEFYSYQDEGWQKEIKKFNEKV